VCVCRGGVHAVRDPLRATAGLDCGAAGIEILEDASAGAADVAGPSQVSDGGWPGPSHEVRESTAVT
jgi:hypothetical protein